MSQKSSNFVPEIVKWVVVCAHHRAMSGTRPGEEGRETKSRRKRK